MIVKKNLTAIITSRERTDRCEADTYDHVFRLCPSPVLHQCRVSMNAQMDQYALSTDLEKLLVPQLIQLVLSPDGHRICPGNWNTSQLASLSNVLLPTDSSEAIHAVLLDFSRTLVPRIDAPVSYTHLTLPTIYSV